MSFARINNSGDWLPMPQTPEFSAYLSPPPERNYKPNTNYVPLFSNNQPDIPSYSSFDTRSAASQQSQLSSYVPPFARADSWRSGHPTATDIESSPIDRRESGPSCSPSRGIGLGVGTVLSSKSKSKSKTMPKNFTKPLTCFYWATNGHCSKLDDDCWYAHWWTGTTAAAPVKVGPNDPVAGKYTSSRLETAMDRETKLDARLDVIVARERDVKFNEDAIDKSAENLKVSIQEVFNALDQMKRASVDTRIKLERHREDVVVTSTYLSDPHNGVHAFHDIGVQILGTVDGLLRALAGMQTTMAKIEQEMAVKVGSTDDANDE